MAQYGNETAVEALGARFRQECLVEQKSLLTGDPLWLPVVFDELYAHYNENVDESSRTFDAKILDQLSGASSDAWQLFAELYILDFLVLGNVLPKTKINKVNALLERCEPPLTLDGLNAPKGAADVVATFDNGGVLNGGQGYNAGRWRQFQYLIDFGRRWSLLPENERKNLMSSSEGMEHAVFGLAEVQEPQIQRALCYLLDPRSQIPITSGPHIERIVKHFGHYLSGEDQALSLQRQASIIRDKIRLERDPDWEFYDDPDEWNIAPKTSRKKFEEIDTQLVEDSPGEVSESVDGEFPLPYFPADSAESFLVSQDWLDDFHRLLSRKKQVIFQGPPGTGKTYLARRMAVKLARAADRVSLVQFHPAYTYEDFFEGFRPNSGGGLELREGPLRKLAEKADEEPEVPFFLIIDEMNRGNLARIFGELYFLLEYRNEELELMYSQDKFSLPPNLYIIGTMNTADRSIALVDSAMRRRFGFMQLDPRVEPTSELLEKWCEQEGLSGEVTQIWGELNRRIEQYDSDAVIGPSYFMRSWVHEVGGLENLWGTEVAPQLRESFYGREQLVDTEFSLRAIRAALDL